MEAGDELSRNSWFARSAESGGERSFRYCKLSILVLIWNRVIPVASVVVAPPQTSSRSNEEESVIEVGLDAIEMRRSQFAVNFSPPLI